MPTVSIGLPVYNGEAYLPEALRSLEAQTWTDFEVILCDNASTDRTPDICRPVLQRDPRFQYIRSPRNLGAAANFNQCVRRASGEFFKWMAHDDLIAPAYLAQHIAALRADPAAVLAFPRATVINCASEPVAEWTETRPTDAADPAVRFGSMLGGHRCYPVFGLIRRDILLRTPLIAPFAASDTVLLAELALYGRFLKIPDPLFFPRSHQDQSMRMVGDFHAYAEWFDPALGRRLIFPWWRRLREYIRVVRRVPLPLSVRLACCGEIARWAHRSRGRLRGDLTRPIRRRVKESLGVDLPSRRGSRYVPVR